MKSLIYCYMGTPGQVVEYVKLPWEKEAPKKEDIVFSGSFEDETTAYIKKTRGKGPGDVEDIALEDGMLKITVVPFSNRGDFMLKIGDQEFPKASFDETYTVGLDKFAEGREGDVLYRLYSPESKGPRPLILYLHGGGNGGKVVDGVDMRDNCKQVLTDYGPINLALDYPDVYVFCPQAIEKGFPGGGKTMPKQTFVTAWNDPDHGWGRRYLGEVCDIIRRMIDEGKVDPNRVYVTGLSMGGAGTIRAMSVGSDLFAACAPICPTMMPETYEILAHMNKPVWVSTAYVDHTIYRHKYIVDAVMNMKDEGNKNAHLTIYSPEELAKYDIGIAEDLTYEKLFSINHMSWVPTYHNEYGIISWLLNQHK